MWRRIWSSDFCWFLPCRDQQIPSESSPITCSLRRVHTTPNTITNLSVPSVPVPTECLVCSELALLIHFFPCQHSIVCEECSRRMKKCIKCQVTITKKLKQGTACLKKLYVLKYSQIVLFRIIGFVSILLLLGAVGRVLHTV
ncbi:E3 ubiquitin-protein ligase MIB2-like [Malurus melanocephalus]|uniref:E3 ubiquitin-protein ligase MIB2-like n=1 Tax=Malurus melanocephalus TaxID=175006 RepID=UPI002548F057|nr:E3 ubiquitin-protein ligase MIB2-like [Malurus melanocephalus]